MDWIEESGVRRFFRAKMKLNSPGMLSHITQRAAGMDQLFHEEDDYLEFLGRKDSEEGKVIIPECDFAELMHKLVEKRPIELPKNKEARRYLIEQLLSRGYTRKEIAKRLSISRKTVYNIITAPLPLSGQAGNG